MKRPQERPERENLPCESDAALHLGFPGTSFSPRAGMREGEGEREREPRHRDNIGRGRSLLREGDTGEIWRDGERERERENTNARAEKQGNSATS